MADAIPSTTSPQSPSPPPPPFVEVICKISGRNYRFASGTKAEFAVSLINRKLGFVNPRVIYIEAFKEGEEPISFGPHADLVDYGHNWRLKTVTDTIHPGAEHSDGVSRQIPKKFPPLSPVSDDSELTRRSSRPEAKQRLGLYIGKILIAFAVMFVLGAFFTIALENLPRLILLLNSSM
ncbi:PREDICTED: uncharacterized protein LOC104823775 [Tarenaya hassleriana]|uniref:uncharacterized protein LOC104823775 n=1 Tax=Tarenaya hassleriana TaxID=28532 RepID=UPI00053C5862|nr:PREDICTED: uncharacterized protein LOC104823775 [Tarenaya hassleriana]XP_010553792.1 PREDICTED: uncharacterized protein LOC104823775 [Tarenaya hassleriana]